jgi:NADH-quinone oxidoreductase subunit N
MLSLAGIPLTAGFIGKFMMFSTALTEYHIWLVVLAVVNAVIGIFYYFRVIVAMYFKSAERNEIQSSAYFNFVLGFSALITVLVGVYPGFISSLF